MTAVLFASLIWKVIDWLRELVHLPTTRSSVLTQLTAWGGGVLLVLVGAHAAVTSAIVLPGTGLPLGKLDAGSILLVGLLASSLASSLVDVKQALDGSDSAAKPPLIPPNP